jgi:hypothetical protein
VSERGGELGENLRAGFARMFVRFYYLRRSLRPGVWDILYYSLATMLEADTGGLSTTGATRWISFSQSLVAKALEIVIVGVGITLILNKMTTHL